MMNRRGFLGSILALAAAPAIVRADSLMRIVPLAEPIRAWTKADMEAAIREKMAQLKADIEHQLLSNRREDLSDIIWDIAPMETPFVSKAKYTWHQNPTIHQWVGK